MPADSNMSSGSQSPIGSSLPFRPSKPQRVLACVRCQQRKVKCDRRFPCSHCNTSRTQCIPATLTPRSSRKRRFPERELLERLRSYETLLRQNNIKFEPMHKDSVGEIRHPAFQDLDSDEDLQNSKGEFPSTPSSVVSSDRVYGAKSFWHAMSPGFPNLDTQSKTSNEEEREHLIKTEWIEYFGDNDHLLFGNPDTSVDLSTLHPEPVHIFRLWQIYLDNVDPLMKVTHTPSLQGRIIEAAGNVSSIEPSFEALMFSIYSISVLSLTSDDCEEIFSSCRAELLTRFQFGCRQALLNSHFLRSRDRECLTALYLFLISVRQGTVPQSVSSMLGVAMRIAQRMGIHNEAVLSKCSVFEAELRRRLWWSLVFFDARVDEMSDSKSTSLSPLWDCQVPVNINDSDLRSESKSIPIAQANATDSIFAVVRSELGEFLRHTGVHLDYTYPALRVLARPLPPGSSPDASEFESLEKMIEEKYLNVCDAENPLHFTTMWWARGYLAKCRLLEHLARYDTNQSVPQTEFQKDVALTYAIRMLECDTNWMTSPSAKRFMWFSQFHFPFPAYIQIVQDIRRRPGGENVFAAWEAMSDNFDARFGAPGREEGPFFGLFSSAVMQAWQACEAVLPQTEYPVVVPRIVYSVQQKLSTMAQAKSETGSRQHGSVDSQENPLASIGSVTNDVTYELGSQQAYESSGSGLYSNMFDPGLMSGNIDTTTWGPMEWGFGGMYPGAWNSAG